MTAGTRFYPKSIRLLMTRILAGLFVVGGLFVPVSAAEVTAPIAASAAPAAARSEEPEPDPIRAMIDALLYRPDPRAPTMSEAALQAAVDRAIADRLPTVTLTGNVRLTESIKVRGLSRPLVIDGAGYTLSFMSPAADHGRHILVTQPDGLNLTLTLRNMRLEGPVGGFMGGGVSVASGVDMTLDTCVVTACKAKEGGAVYNYNNNITVINSILAGNTAEAGGGLYSYYGHCYVEGSYAELSNNHATAEDAGGGAIYGHSGNIVVRDGARLLSNTAIRSGGAVYLHSGGVISADSALFAYNTAADGGALAIGEEASFIDLRDSRFLYNKAIGRTDGTGGLGGAVYRQGDGLADIDGCFFLANEANFGGAVFTGSGTEDCLMVDATTFRGNMAAYDGGAIYASDRITSAQPRPALVTVSRFDNNQAGRNGGALYSPNHAALTLIGVGFADNTARTSAEWDIEAPADLYAVEAAIYKNNIRSVEPSRRLLEDVQIPFPNVYNNWDINFPISLSVAFRSWGGRWADIGDMANRRQVLFIGEQAAPPAEALRDDYYHGGWQVATAGHPDEGRLWSFGDPVLRTMALDAVWLTEEESAKMILKPMGGTWGDSGTRNLTIYVRRHGYGYQPDTLTRDGYRFLGWFNQQNNQRWNFGTDKIHDESVVLVARWAALPGVSTR